MMELTPASRLRPRLNVGLFALIVAAGGVALPMFACVVLPLIGASERTWLFHGFSWFQFDFAFPLSVIALILAIIGFTQPGRSRLLAAIALAVLAAPWLLILF